MWMKKERYIVKENSISKRREFYNYIINNYDLKLYDTEEHYINNMFPFVVDFKHKKFWICDSITVLRLAEDTDKVITIDEFMEKISN